MVLEKINNVRKLETFLIYKETFYRSLIEFITNIVPIAISVSVFGFYVYLGYELTVPKVFIIIYINYLNQVLMDLIY